MASIWDDLPTGPSKKAIDVEKTPERGSIWDDISRPSIPETEKNKPGFISDIKRGYGQIASGLGSALRDTALKDIGEDIEKYGADIVERNPSEIRSVSDAISSPFTTAREAVGEMVPQVGGSVAGQVAGRAIGSGIGALTGPAAPLAVPALGTVGQFIGGLAVPFVQSYGGIRSEQRASGDESIPMALATAVPSALLERYSGGERIASKVVGKGTSFLARESGEKFLPHVLKQGVRGFVEEAVTEIPQTVLERAGAFKDLTSAEALDEYALAGIKGGLGGGVFRGGLSAVAGRREGPTDGSILTGATNNLTENSGAGTDGDNIKAAINDQQSNTVQVDNTAAATTASEEAARQAAEKAAAEQAAQQQAIEQEKLKQEQFAQARQETFNKFGGEVVPIGNKQAFKFQGKFYYTEAQLNSVLDKLTEAEQAKPELQRAVEKAYLAAQQATGGKTLSPTSLVKAIAPYIDQVDSIEEALARVQLELDNALAQVKTPQQLAKVEPLHVLRDELAGVPPEERVPTTDLLPKGKQDERLQLQDTAGLRAVPEQGRTTEAGGEQPGTVRPDQVRPIGAGSNIALTSPEQNVGQGSVRARVEPSASGVDNAVPSVGQEQAQGQVNEAQQSAAQKGRGGVSEQTVARDGAAAETDETRAESIVKQVITNIIDAVVVRKGRMTKANLAKLKDFIYYDHFQVAGKAKDGVSKKELAQMFGVTTDTIDGWQAIADKFFEENRGVIQQKILEALAQNNLTLNDLMVAVQARRDNLLNDAVILEEGQSLAEATTKDDEQAVKGELKEAPATDLELTEDESVLDQRDLGDENSGVSVSTGRVQQSIQEKNKPEETINARMKRKLEEYNKAIEEGDEEAEARLMQEIDDLTKEAKQVSDKKVRISEEKAPKAKKQPKERKKRAVQKPSAEKVPVREGTGSSEKVGKRDTEKREATTEGKTDEEIWDSLGVPVKYAELTEQAKADWMLSVKEGKTNLAAANKVFEDNEGAITVEGKTRASFAFAKQDVMTSSSTKEKLSVATTTFDKLAVAFPGLQRVKEKYEALGIGNALNAVEQWMVTDSPVKWDAIITLQDGKVTVIVNKEVFADAATAALAGSHEIGHAVDYTITHSGVYSDNQTFNLFIGKDGQVKGMGEVAKEIISLYNSDSKWKLLMAYPLDTKTHNDLDANAIREELFAQLWSYMTNTNGRAYIEQTAPKTFAYMQGVINDVQKQTYGQTARQSLGRPQIGQAKRETTADTGTEGRIQEVGGGVRESRQARKITDLPKPLQGPVSEITATINDLALRGYTYWAFTENLAKTASKYLKSATDYVKYVREQQAIKTKYERRVDLILQMYDKVDAKFRGTGPGSINAFLKASTMAGKWGFDPGYLKKAPEIDEGLKGQFEALPKSAQDVIRAVFKHGFDTLRDMKQGVIDNITSEYDALIAEAKKANDLAEVAKLEKKKAAQLKDYQSLMVVREGKPYAPLKRFGSFVVVAKSDEYLQAEADAKDTSKTDEQRKEARSKLRELEKNEDDYYVAFAETKREGRAIEKKLRNAGYGYVSEAFEKDSTRTDVYGGRDVQNVFYRLRNLANESLDEKGGDKTARAVNRLINDLHLTLLAEQSARQSERRRRKIAGAEDDMMRSFATQGLATAHFIATLHNSGKIYDSLQQMKREADAQTPGRDKRREYYNEFMRRHALGLEYEPSPLIGKAMSVTSFWMLLTNPAYYLQNLTQPFMMSLPVMAGKHGYDKSWSEFNKAYKQLFTLINKEGLSEETYAKLPADVRNAIETLVDQGRIDISLDQDLGRWRDAEGSKTELVGTVVEKLRKTAQDIESLNRVATAVAAYRLEVQSGAKPEDAVKYADDIILSTHGDYSGFNAPRITRQGIGRLATQFRKFQLIQIALMAKLVRESFKGASQKERMVARRALAFTLGHALAVGGIMGLPGFTAIAWIMGAAFGDEDEPDNPELTLRKMIGDKALSDIILKGAPKFFGVDLSGKLGMGQMLSILPYTDVDLSKAGVAQAGYALAFGATGSLVQRAAEGLSLMGQGDYYKGLEKLSPKGLEQAMKAGRFLVEGVTLKNGDVVMKPEEISFLDGLSVAIGLPSNKITDRMFVQGAAIEYDKFYKERTSEIKRDYVKAYNNKDTAGMAEAREEWNKLQDAKAKNKLKRQPLSDLIKAPQEQKKRERSVEGGVETSKSNRQFIKEISKL